MNEYLYLYVVSQDDTIAFLVKCPRAEKYLSEYVLVISADISTSRKIQMNYENGNNKQEILQEIHMLLLTISLVKDNICVVRILFYVV